jgi:hypothetical protein
MDGPANRPRTLRGGHMRRGESPRVKQRLHLLRLRPILSRACRAGDSIGARHYGPEFVGKKNGNEMTKANT